MKVDWNASWLQNSEGGGIAKTSVGGMHMYPLLS